MSAGLTTHVLDTNREGPAEGVEVTLYRLEEGDREQIVSAVTNHDGRVDEPLLDAEEIDAGTFELVFDVGTYYREGPTESTFLDEVPVRFLIDDPSEHYHVPLLLSPGSYTTYRGS
ncbi:MULTISPECIES: hydroxyisourate hydrolase [unclassified Halorubrum]|uniref:hydroxyisourate hydrolase n=1 Tax=unclassified Halorubrum TaxID=2642239 RepID=UPI000B988633|nr:MULTISPECIES: hydroxyisourate hydrolase [unclassified Halorubrum]OYR39122.1 hydroxyisourate hydrolase [Halorubrum sp. Hd13]OYR44777.1 hydroxyisourate hydrolase [Halorubrum sp. Ea8]